MKYLILRSEQYQQSYMRQKKKNRWVIASYFLSWNGSVSQADYQLELISQFMIGLDSISERAEMN